MGELRPALMMMVVAMLGLVPTMLATVNGSYIQRPMATVVVNGLAFAILVSIFCSADSLLPDGQDRQPSLHRFWNRKNKT